jgi:tagatose 1,6-diphosphate aldolase
MNVFIEVNQAIFVAVSSNKECAEIFLREVLVDSANFLSIYLEPDGDPEVCAAQQEFTRRTGEACKRYDIPFVFELLVYPLARDAEQTREYVEMKTKQATLVIDSVRTFADPRYGVDLFKLESPVPAADVPEPGAPGSAAVQALFHELDRAAGRPWVMLSAGAGMVEFKRVLHYAYAAGASGYLAGRAIWLAPFQRFPDWDGIRDALRSQAVPYMRELNSLTDSAARPWHTHPCYGPGGARVEPADSSFRHAYAGIGG